MDRAAAAQRLIKFEGSTSFMYLDTAGIVTTGVGHAILNKAHALTLPWEGAPSAGAIAADYARVAAAPTGHAASHYEPLTNCRLRDEGIKDVLLADVAAFESELEGSLPAWRSYPEPAQQAIFDIAYNLGIGGLLKFHKLLAACNAGEWETASTECRRRGIGEARNQETAALFRKGAEAANTRKIDTRPLPEAA